MPVVSQTDSRKCCHMSSISLPVFGPVTFWSCLIVHLVILFMYRGYDNFNWRVVFICRR